MIRLNYRDARPIYEQVKDGLRHLVVTGALQEREGYLYTVAGKGSFAAPQADVNADRRARLLEQFDASAAELLFLGLTAGELAARLQAAETGRTGHREEERA